jgi:hypothetical protein
LGFGLICFGFCSDLVLLTLQVGLALVFLLLRRPLVVLLQVKKFKSLLLVDYYLFLSSIPTFAEAGKLGIQGAMKVTSGVTSSVTGKLVSDGIEVGLGRKSKLFYCHLFIYLLLFNFGGT